MKPVMLAGRGLLWMVVLTTSACVVRDEVSVAAKAELAFAAEATAAVAVKPKQASGADVAEPAASEPASGAAGTFAFGPHTAFRRMADGTYVDYQSIVVGDFNGDGRADIAAQTASNIIDLLLQNQDGTFGNPLVYDVTSKSYSAPGMMAIGDFNGDSIDDVAFRYWEDYPGEDIGVLLSRRDSTPYFLQGYRDTTSDPAADQPKGMVTLDVDRDGHADIVYAYGWKQGGATECPDDVPCPNFKVVYGDGQGRFGRSRTSVLGSSDSLHDFTKVDLNRDGLEDLVFVTSVTKWGADGPEWYGRILALHGLPGGGFGPVRHLHDLTRSGHDPIEFGDLNGDGLVDSLNQHEVHLGRSDGSFDGPLFMNTYRMFPLHSIIADFDGDLRDDVVNKQFDGYGTIPFLAVYLQRNGSLDTPILIQDPPELSSGFQVSHHRDGFAVGDFNGDGCNDLAAAAGWDGIVVLYGENCTRMRTGGNLPPLRM